MRIKLSYFFANEPLLRQTPGSLGIWKGHEFLCNSGSAERCDIWVVLEDTVDTESAHIGTGRAVLLTMEPPSLRSYQPAFLAQFDRIVTCHRGLRHPSVSNTYQGQTWHIGLRGGAEAGAEPPRRLFTYDDFRAMPAPEKTVALSVICSTKSRTPGHRARLEFVEKLQARLRGRVDVFGRGVRDISDKADAIIPYRYHVALENSRVADYWTEKLSDSFLGWSFPIYWGCPNIADYLPENSLIEIDIEKPAASIDRIVSTIDAPLSEERFAALTAARELVLDRYNTFDVVRRTCEALTPAAPREIVIRPQSHFKPSSIRRNADRLIGKIVSRFR